MPTYKNNNSKYLVINNVTFPPGEEVETNFYINTQNYDNLKQTSEEPTYSPVAYSKICSSGETVNVTELIKPETNAIRLLAKSNTASISFNDKSNPAVLLTSRHLDVRPINRINTIHILDGEVSVELWNEFLWR